jgi:hypothetical protein
MKIPSRVGRITIDGTLTAETKSKAAKTTAKKTNGGWGVKAKGTKKATVKL